MWQRTKHTHGTVNEGRSHVDAKTEALVFNLLFNQKPVLLAVRDFSQECETDSSRFSHGIQLMFLYIRALAIEVGSALSCRHGGAPGH